MSLLQTFEAHGCEVQVGGLERELAYLYVLLDRKVLSKIIISIVMHIMSVIVCRAYSAVGTERRHA